MQAFLSTSCYGRRPVDEAINLCKAISGNFIEISAPHNYQPIEKLAVTLEKFKNEGVKFALHNYFPSPQKSFVLNISSTEKEIIKKSEELIKSAFYLAEISGAPIYGVHAGYLSKAKANSDGYFEFDKEEEKYSVALNNTKKFLHNIIKFKPEGVQLIIENLFPSPKKRHSINCSFDEINELMSSLPNDIGMLLDLGHLNVSSNILGFDRDKAVEKILDKFFNRVKEIHISENNGFKDEHLAVKKNSWQLDIVKSIRSLEKKYNNKIIYCIEARNASDHELRKSVELVNLILS